MKPLAARLATRTSVNSESATIGRKESKSDDFNSRLAAEIVIHAVSDWRELIKKQAWVGYQHPQCNFKELRDFFKSEWCDFLMQDFGIDPERLLATLDKELKEAMEKYEEEKIADDAARRMSWRLR